MHNKTEENIYKKIAEDSSVDYSTVRTVILSFFGSMTSYARSLPFDNNRKIYTRTKFNELVRVFNIPFIGRIGPSYTRYLRWRANESKYIEFKNKDEYKAKVSREQIEEAARRMIEGEKIKIEKQKQTDLYKRVWIVGENEKRQARQVIPKEQ